MSKIEKALRRARSEKGLVVVQGGQSSSASDAPASDSREIATREDSATSLRRREAAAAAIATMRETALRDKTDLVSQGIILPDLAENPTVQAFREIRTKILHKTRGRSSVVMVTSVSSRGGSSFVATNLAVAFAFDAGKTALLVDCNLRNPGIQKQFPDTGKSGLTDYLESEKLDVSDIIHPVGIERLRVVPAGKNREMPSEYFTSSRMKHLLDEIRERYAERFIILDAPPMSETADTQILAELCDYILLVVPYGRVTSGQLDSCLKALDAKKMLGTVFNNEPLLPGLDWKGILLEPYRQLWNRLRSSAQSIIDAVRKK